MPNMDIDPIDIDDETEGEDPCDVCGELPDDCNCRTCVGRRCGVRVESLCRNCERCEGCGCTCDEDSDGESGVHVERFTSPLTFHTGKPVKGNPSKRFVAVEIEVAGIEMLPLAVAKAVRGWNGSIVSDGSLPDEGFEINTAPASGDSYLGQIDDICTALEASDARVNTDCGLHVHIDARDYTYYDLRRLIFLYERIEPALFRLVAPSRRDNRYCLPCGEQFGDSMRLSAMPKESKSNIYKTLYKHGPSIDRNKKRGACRDKYDSSRYSALNIHSWFYRGTIEFRAHHGTVAAKGIKAWGVLWARLLDYALASTEKKINALPKDPMLALLEIAKGMPEIHGWLVARTLYFAKREGIQSNLPGSVITMAELREVRLNNPSGVTATETENS